MARIRTVKPSFFRHEKLQELEIDNPGSYIMLTFMGLWTLCDSKGKFEYKPRQIKLDILPFIDYDMAKTLDLLVDNQFIICYEASKNTYGKIPTFTEHQRITGKELNEGERFPDPPKLNENQLGSNWETTGKHPFAQEEEREEERGKGKDVTPASQGDKEKSFVELFNKLTGRKFETLDSKAKGQFKARLNEGHNSKNFTKAIKVAIIEMTERGTDKYLTPEFITRPAEFSKYFNMDLRVLESNNPYEHPIDHDNRP